MCFGSPLSYNRHILASEGLSMSPVYLTGDCRVWQVIEQWWLTWNSNAHQNWQKSPASVAPVSRGISKSKSKWEWHPVEVLWVPRRHVSTWMWCLAGASIWQSTTHWRGPWLKGTEKAEDLWPQPESQLSQALGTLLALPDVLGEHFTATETWEVPCWLPELLLHFPVTCCF